MGVGLVALRRSGCSQAWVTWREGAAAGRQLVRSQVCVSWQGFRERRAANSAKSLGCAAACLVLAWDPPVVWRARLPRGAGNHQLPWAPGESPLLPFETSWGFRRGRPGFSQPKGGPQRAKKMTDVSFLFFPGPVPKYMWKVSEKRPEHESEILGETGSGPGRRINSEPLPGLRGATP